jgi:pimeloyl-ACP methyl ester carboxylesterase
MEIVIGGNPKGQTVFLLAGYPDSSSVFEENVTRELQYRIVGLTIPWTAARQRWFGYTPEVRTQTTGEAACHTVHVERIQTIVPMQLST